MSLFSEKSNTYIRLNLLSYNRIQEKKRITFGERNLVIALIYARSTLVYNLLTVVFTYAGKYCFVRFNTDKKCLYRNQNRPTCLK